MDFDDRMFLLLYYLILITCLGKAKRWHIFYTREDILAFLDFLVN